MKCKNDKLWFYRGLCTRLFLEGWLSSLLEARTAALLVPGRPGKKPWCWVSFLTRSFLSFSFLFYCFLSLCLLFLSLSHFVSLSNSYFFSFFSPHCSRPTVASEIQRIIDTHSSLMDAFSSSWESNFLFLLLSTDWCLC